MAITTIITSRTRSKPCHDLVDQDGGQLLRPHEGGHQLVLADHTVLICKIFYTFFCIGKA